LLEVDDLEVTFHRHGQVVRAVRGLSLTVSAGRTLAVIGESGSGKTAAARALIGLLPPTAEVGGSAYIAGRELTQLTERQLREVRGRDIAIVLQDPARSLNPTRRIGAQLVEAIRVHLPLSRAQARDRALDLLHLVRIPAAERRMDEYPHQLSGGMRQRVVIAIALACDPKLLIADEATTALDVTTQTQIMELLAELQQRLNMAMVMISHDLGLAAAYSDDIVVMYAGRALEQAPTRMLFERVRSPYTRALLDAIPRLDRPANRRLPIVVTAAPGRTRPETGCPFAPRCPQAQHDCSEEAPALLEHETSHRWACWHPCDDEQRG
jgi:oligopeptide/dipeptide ABC transporter ATP-binding protein